MEKLRGLSSNWTDESIARKRIAMDDGSGIQVSAHRSLENGVTKLRTRDELKNR
jgi:hypothetical protein